MKKSVFTISLSILAGALGVGSLIVGQNTKSDVVNASEEPVAAIAYTLDARSVALPETARKHIDIEELIPAENRAPNAVIRDEHATYWGEGFSYCAIDKFYDDVEQPGDWTGSAWTIQWEQYTPYFLYQWGAANDAHDVGMKVYYFTLEGERIKNAEGHDFDDFVKNNTFTENGMVLRYHQVNQHVLDNYGSTGFKVQIELFDNTPGSGGYAYTLFGGLRPNHTLEEVKTEIYKFYYHTLPAKGGNFQGDMKDRIRRHYLLNDKLSAVFLDSTDTIDGGFETQSSFDSNWFYDFWYADRHGSNAELHFDKTISTGNYRPGTNMPFNKEGNGFFRGWYETATEADGSHGEEGFVADDATTYRFRSKAYRLNEGNHYVSIKMAGTASFHVIDAITQEDLLWVDSKTLQYDHGNEYVHEGFNTCTLRRHVINLSAYAGRLVQFAICDYRDWGWGAAYFDEFVCDFDPSDGLRVDTVIQWRDDRDMHSAYNDIYISSNHSEQNGRGVTYKFADQAVEDTTALKAAAEFIAEYSEYARGAHGNDLCAIRHDDRMKEILTKYAALPASTRAIIDASDDFEQDSPEELWYARPVVITNLGWNLQYLCQENNIILSSNPLLNPFGIRVGQTNGAIIAIPAIIICVGLIAFLGFYLTKKRKAKR